MATVVAAGTAATSSDSASVKLAPPGWAEGGTPANPASQIAADRSHARAECADNTLLLLRVRGSAERPGFDRLGGWTAAAGEAAIVKGWRVRDMQADYRAPALPLAQLGIEVAAAFVEKNPSALLAAVKRVKSYRDVASRSWRSVRDQIVAAYERCPKRTILLAGYSYGGIVLRYVVRNLPASVRAKIIRVDLVADPTAQASIDVKMRHSGGYGARLTTEGLDTWAARKTNPIFKQAHYPADIVERVVQYCLPYDLVCETNPVNLAAFAGESKRHTRYKWTAIGQQAAALLRSWRSTRPSVSTYQLRSGAFPRFLAYSNDGSLWITEHGDDSGPVGYGVIERLSRTALLTQYQIPGSSSTSGSIIKGPDGAIWFSGLEVIGRIDPRTGAVTGWETPRRHALGLPDAIAAGPGRAIWYTNESVPAGINRITSSGIITKFKVPSGSGGLTMPDITVGPDGALWFTQSSVGKGPPASIGRMTASGHYTRWTLPTQHSLPMSITTGPDGALWFTERTADRIGRITMSGKISEFRLPHLAPFDITRGADGALWFTTDTRIGRITTSGKITTWPVAGAKSLIGIVAARGGSFWAADGPADAIRHFIPTK